MKSHKKAIIPQSVRHLSPTKTNPLLGKSFRHRDRGLYQGRVRAA